ncbi:uncharacterized protein BO96DRAFT_430744 [Aspergillus niger CBS 101883]|uniref:uncharacterized protein n=1 Tax=Aspergillus lacticoffeatus (strain CBS 101883) TaxID=1450533 RepID=UPI000D800E05|nr:uncharacterized protein BO96DRAFT_430744 [Aspergillus niger CBS 101883]PYH60837.1 hypothetical protein BO96DRAFT_430744 [Aspergillus niger CBS 101883]
MQCQRETRYAWAMDVWSGMLIDVGCPDWETGWNKPVDRPWRSRKLDKQGTVGELEGARAMMHSGRQSHAQTLHRLAKEVGGSGEVHFDRAQHGEQRPWSTLDKSGAPLPLTIPSAINNSDRAGNKCWGEGKTIRGS